MIHCFMVNKPLKGDLSMSDAEQKTVRIAVKGAELVALDDLVPFQGELKTLDKTNYEKLRKLIIGGFSFTFHVWQKDGKNYIIDGHQRLFTLKQMRDVEGWVVPPVPVSIILEESFEAAKRKVLEGASTFGKMTEDSLFQYMKENDIPFDEAAASYDFMDVNFEKLQEKYNNEEPPMIPDDKTEEQKMPSSSEGVRQVQLFFGSDVFEDFIAKTNEIAGQLGTENITDTIMGCVREVHKAKFPAAQ
jgi:hypothetical protein